MTTEEVCANHIANMEHARHDGRLLLVNNKILTKAKELGIEVTEAEGHFHVSQADCEAFNTIYINQTRLAQH